MRIHVPEKWYGSFRALDRIDLEIPAGGIHALLGPNGSGKTTLLKCLLGLVFPGNSSESLLSYSIDEISGIARDGDPGGGIPGEKNLSTDSIGYMPQNPAFPGNLTVREALDFLERIEGKFEFRRNLEQEFSVIDFQKKKIKNLSQGMIQKMNMVQCFGRSRKLYILDEPTAGLDPSASYRLKKIIEERKTKGETILFTTHILSEVRRLADHIAILIGGRLIARGTVDQFLEEAGTGDLEEAVRVLWDRQQEEANLAWKRRAVRFS